MTRLGKEVKEQWPIGNDIPQDYLNVVVTHEPSPHKKGVQLIVMLIPILVIVCGIWGFTKSAAVSPEVREQAFQRDFSDMPMAFSMFGEFVKDIPKTNSLWPLSLLFAVPFLAFFWWAGDGVVHFLRMFWSSTGE